MSNGRLLGKLLGSSGSVPTEKLAGNITIEKLAGDIPITEKFTTASLLPSSGTIGEQAFVEENNRLYIWNGSGWYSIALINTTPSFDSGGTPEASYTLDSSGGNPIIIQLNATDPEDVPLQWSYVLSDSAQYFANISQDSSVFTITAKNQSVVEQYDSNGGTFSITFKASDGVNFANETSEFTLTFTNPNAFDLSNATSNTVGTTYYQHHRYANTIHFSPDGTKMYENNPGNYQIYYAELSTAWDLSTAVRDGSKTLSVGWNSQDIYLKPDGTVLYTLEVGGGVFEWHMSTAWDLTTAVAQTGVNDYLNIQTALGSGQQPSNLQFINGGSRLYVKSTGSNVFRGFNLTTPWDITTATYASALDFTSGVFGGMMDMGPWKSDGTKFIAHDADQQTIRIYTCSTAWDASTASSTQSRIFNSGTGNLTSGSLQQTRNQPELSADESKLYIFDKQNELMGIRTLNFGTNWDLTTLTENPAFVSPVEMAVSTRAASPTFSTDGTKFFVMAPNTVDKIYQQPVATPFDLSTLGSVQVEINVASYDTSVGGGTLENSPKCMVFKPDGTKLFFAGSGSDSLWEIGLSTAWDLSSADLDASGTYLLSTDAQFNMNPLSNTAGGEREPRGIFFKPDGTKFYICGSYTDRINEFNCATAWSIANVTYHQSFYPNKGNLYGLAFSNDGSKMFTAKEAVSWEILEYALSTPWDISTASLSASHNPGGLLNMATDVYDFNFNADGSKFYIPLSNNTSNSNKLYEFTL